MTEKKNIKMKTMFFISLAISIVLMVFRTVLLVKYIEPDTGFYAMGTKAGYVFDGLVLLAMIFVVVCGYMLKKVETPNQPDSKSTVVVFSSALCALMFFSVFAYGVYCFFALDNVPMLFKIQVILCVPCGINHLTICSKETREKDGKYALLSMSNAVFFAVRLIDVFMSQQGQMNISQRSLELLMLCAMMLFSLAETSFLISNNTEGLTSVGRYFSSGLATVILTCVAVIPYLIVSVFWWYEAEFVVMDVLECCVMLFVASRLITINTCCEKN